ncbi:MAG: hypothetical protein F6K21_05580 [Symploca sp. SIO2D2]|nr:hypothetical protein [Symploca sp. SIO2D2]
MNLNTFPYLKIGNNIFLLAWLSMGVSFGYLIIRDSLLQGQSPAVGISVITGTSLSVSAAFNPHIKELVELIKRLLEQNSSFWRELQDERRNARQEQQDFIYKFLETREKDLELINELRISVGVLQRLFDGPPQSATMSQDEVVSQLGNESVLPGNNNKVSESPQSKSSVTLPASSYLKDAGLYYSD